MGKKKFKVMTRRFLNQKKLNEIRHETDVLHSKIKRGELEGTHVTLIPTYCLCCQVLPITVK